MTTNLRRAILYTHRWLGIAGGLLFVLWFASGIAMLWARMPELDSAERLRRLPELDLDAARVAPVEAARALGLSNSGLRIAMLGERPVYRFDTGPRSTTVFADDGQPFAGLGDDEVMRLARALFPEHAATLRHDRRLESPDQWTLQNGGALPLHRLALGDPGDTWIYLSAPTGELILTATASERRRAYASAVPHWLYVTPLRRHGVLWSRMVVGLSLAGCVVAASGLIWGLWQALRAGDRSSRARVATPYAGLMRWHHYAGLAFGLFAFTWVLSGCLSMDPLPWQSYAEPTVEQAAAVAGEPIRLEALTIDRLRASLAALAAEPEWTVKELELVHFRSEPFLLGHGSPPSSTQSSPHALVSALRAERGAFARFGDDDVVAAARSAMPAARVIDATWLQRHDAYYYDLHGPAPLPVLRARFDDPARTWLYVDPATGAIARMENRSSRLNRWLYHGLHSFDFPFLLRHRTLRDAIIVVLSLGGILIAVTSMADGWRRVGRHVRRLR
ncbi:MAG TPA: PepSY domain-containing protein [Thermoanaerobaculia bacterium]|nr:PepSY domain-containing protein [Thermoanaerobaculia bacterium]